MPLRFGGSVFGVAEVVRCAGHGKVGKLEAAVLPSALIGGAGVVVANLAVVPVQVLLDEVDDLRGHVVPVEGTGDGDANLVDVQADAGDAFDVVERQGRLDGGGAVVANGEPRESVSTRKAVVELLGSDALVDVELTNEVVGELLDDDTRVARHGLGFLLHPWRAASRIASVWFPIHTR